MTEADILHWFRDTSLGAAVRHSRWMFATGETFHFLGLSLLVGGILIVDLRLLGFLRHISMRSALSFLPFAIIGFVINLLTGILFFTADPMMYWPNPAFRLKMFSFCWPASTRSSSHCSSTGRRLRSATRTRPRPS